jgi:hypothetical protein
LESHGSSAQGLIIEATLLKVYQKINPDAMMYRL